MKKISIIAICLIFFNKFIYTQTYNAICGNGDETSIILNYDSTMTVETFSRETGEESHKTFSTTKSEIHGIPFLTIGNKQYLCLKCDEVFYLYADNGRPFFAGTKFSYMESEFIKKVTGIKSSSHLSEGKIVYSSEDLSDAIGKPWVEGAEKNGIGEWIKFNVNPRQEIYISIGFVDYYRPNLYLDNSRPKTIMLYFNDVAYKEIHLLDTPDFQKIIIPKTVKENSELKIEILDVYPGIKYEDTCINMILCNEIPYYKGLK